jgi:diguanylate cyclase (GGDEF)-like protein
MPWARFVQFLLMLLVCTLAGTAPARAQAGVAGQPVQVCILRDTGGLTPVQLFREPERFDCRTDQIGLGVGDFWVLSQPIDRVSPPDRSLRVRSASLWQSGEDLYVRYADGTIRAQHTDARGVAPLIQLGAIVEQPIAAAPAPVERLLWHVHGSANLRGIKLGVRLADAEQSVQANLTMGALYAAFGGLCLALIVYNLALWSALRHRFQFYYCLMAAGMLAYAVTSSGVLAWMLPFLSNNDRLRLNYLLLGATGTAALTFARHFFEPRIFAGWLGRYAALLAGGTLLAGALFFVTAPFAVHLTDALFTLIFLGLSTLVVPTLWRAWRLRSNYLWLFAIGWGAPILTAGLRGIANLGFIPWSFWLDNSTLLAMMVEALISAVAIAYRIKLLRGQRDEALAGEVTARRLADIDPLTGLLNRRAFLSQAIGRAGEQKLLIADLDHFKRVNQTLGHDGGDEVLRVFARLLRTGLPAGALVARLGGEEFAMVADADVAIDPDAILARLRRTRMPFDVQVTASIGACHGLLVDERDWKAMYRDADLALYQAKSAGRDRACVAASHEARTDAVA